jgi:hypothetical protein
MHVHLPTVHVPALRRLPVRSERLCPQPPCSGFDIILDPHVNAIQVSGGVTLLASFSVACIFGMFALYYFGASLRKRSRFAG